MTEALVSIIVPVYNREHTLTRAAESALAQSWKDLELILVDDASTDSSLATAKQIASDDPRVRILANERSKGAPGARNTGLLAAHGKWIAFLDSDDCLQPRMIERLVERIKTSQADVVTCHTELSSQQSDGDRKVGEFCWNARGDIRQAILTGETYVDMNAALMLRTRLLAIGGLDEKCPSYQEWDLHIRLSQTCRYDVVPEALVKYYQHDGQMSKDEVRSLRGLLYVYQKHKHAWLAKGLSDNWKQRILELCDEISSVRKDRMSMSLAVVRTEPRVFVWLVIRFLRRLAGGAARRVLGRRATPERRRDDAPQEDLT